jgi:membrane fusion protein (multidrug efflux system)
VLESALERAQLHQAELRLREARAEWIRFRDLRESHAASERALEAAEIALGLRRAEHEVAREQLARRTLLARFDGVIGETRFEPGEVVSPGAIVATLLSLEELEIEIGVPGYQIGEVVPGARVFAVVPAVGSEPIEGRVHEVAPAAARGGHLFAVRVRLQNADGRLRPGMNARVRIVTEVVDRAVVVPLEAVVERRGERVVFFVEDGRARSVPVTGARLHEDRLLLVTVPRAAELVLRGQRDLHDDTPVRVDNSILEGLLRTATQ